MLGYRYEDGGIRGALVSGKYAGTVGAATCCAS